jgi:uncharacterized protein involved in outer membrane biogenesis
VQTTLLGLAIAIILALVAAMVGPFFIDWNRVRPYAEAEATRIIGSVVKINGPIDARLLPTPTLDLQAVTVGTGKDAVRIGKVAVEFGLGPLLQGKLRAAEMHVAKPQVSLSIDHDGHIAAPVLAKAFGGQLDANVLSIEKLTIEDASASVTDTRSGATNVFDKLWFNGEVGSLRGPFKGEGGLSHDGIRTGYRINAGRADDNGQLKLRVNIDPTDRPLSLEADGSLALDEDVPHFVGTLKVARLAGVELANGQTVVNDPWQLTANLDASLRKALLEKIAFKYGPEKRAIDLTGTADVQFGAHPHFDSVLSALQIDLDRATATKEVTQQKPADVLKILADMMTSSLQPPFPGRIGLGIESLTIGGSTVRQVRGDIVTDGRKWSLEGFEFRAPGLSQVTMSGDLDLSGKRVGFSGPISLDSGDPATLVNWLTGSGENNVATMSPLQLSGDVTLRSEKIAIEHLRTDIDKKSVRGRVVYAWPIGDKPASLDAELKAEALDLDSLVSLVNAARGTTTFEMPQDIVLSMHIGKATIAGLEAKSLDARLIRNDQGLSLEHIGVADLAGTAAEGKGTIDLRGKVPTGSLSLAIDAHHVEQLLPLAAAFAPAAVEPLRRFAARVPSAKFKTVFNLDHAGDSATAKIDLTGEARGLRIKLNARVTPVSADIATMDLAVLNTADIHVTGTVTADDASVITQGTGLGAYFSVARGPGDAALSLDGIPSRKLAFDGHLTAQGLTGTAKGTGRLTDKGPETTFHASMTAADPLLLRPSSQRATKGETTGAAKNPGAAEAVPVAMAADVNYADHVLKLSGLKGTVGQSSLHGALSAVVGDDVKVDGTLEADKADLVRAIGSLAGVYPLRVATDKGNAWSRQPFGGDLIGDRVGKIQLKIGRATLTPWLEAKKAQATLVLSHHKVALSDIKGTADGGALSGHLTLDRNSDGMKLDGELSLTKADAAQLFAAQGRAPVSGRISTQIEFAAAGLSPEALVGSMTGSGTVTLEHALMADLDPKAFSVAIADIDEGAKPDVTKVTAITDEALRAGNLSVPSAEGAIMIGAGQVRVSKLTAQAKGADVGLSGRYDLLDGRLDVRVTLSATQAPQLDDVEPPVIYVALRGPFAAPARSIDASALTAWLTLRSIEQQSKKLKALEKARHDAALEEQRQPALEKPAPSSAATPPTAAVPPTSPPQTAPHAAAPRKPVAPAHPASAAAPAARATHSVPAGRAPSLPPPVEIRPAPKTHSAVRSNRRPAPAPAFVPMPAPEPIPRPGAPLWITPFP